MKKNILSTIIITAIALCIGFFAGRQTQDAEVPELSAMTGNYYDYKVVETVDGNTWMIDQLWCREVGNISTYFSRIQGFQNILFVDQTTAGKIQDFNPIFHQRNRFFIDGIFGFVVERNMDRDKVTVFI